MFVLLQVCQSPGFSMDILDLLGPVGIKFDNLATGRGVASLLKVGAEATEEFVGTLGDAVALVRGAGTVGGVVLLVKILNGAEETVRHAVLGVEVDGPLDGSVSDDVAMS